MSTDQQLTGWKAVLAKIPVIGKPLAGKLKGKPSVAVLRLYGVIGQAGGPLRRGGLNLHDLETVIDEAFKTPNLKAVALAINSPGGSPVQSALIAARIRQLAEEKDIPILAFCEDAAASGGYWLACAADEIYAQPASVVGSIGVISAGFGFTEMISKIGVERRVYTSGESKSQLDPFSPEKAADVKHLKELQNDIHEQFKDFVRSRRDGRLKEEEKKLFSGSFWTGARGVDLGLVDATGELKAVCREKFGDKVEFKDVSRPKSWIQKRLGLEGKISKMGEEILEVAESRIWWSRLGL
ncbi:S49 family peptidase [Aestuariispira insulae]|uniref:Signal peptide peptidase SppA n=1 Tax=Aestuariispira insulae TaxID=1461337 RepID=A0A3D9HW08_9PROT|nr:S49 family peptidase [Aestuariispira insulae]RED53694.1 signal peptide peptidase SppA [Aestuariispira insulae]